MSVRLDQIDKLPPAMKAQALADQARAAAARERIMAQVGQPPKPVDMKLGHASFTPHEKPQLNSDPYRTFPYGYRPSAKSPKNTVSAQMQAILPQCPGVKVKQPRVPETVIQQDLVRWWKLNCCDWNLEEEYLIAIPNAGKRSARNGARMVAEGLRSGVPDVLVAVPRGDCGALWIEMKTCTGVLRESQRLMLARLAKVGYATVVCRSTEEAIAAITAYLNLPTPSKP